MSDTKATKDLLSRQERVELEFFEKYESVPHDETNHPLKPIHRRLFERGLLAAREPSANSFGKSIGICDRGLTALRGGTWNG